MKAKKEQKEKIHIQMQRSKYLLYEFGGLFSLTNRYNCFKVGNCFSCFKITKMVN